MCQLNCDEIECGLILSTTCDKYHNSYLELTNCKMYIFFTVEPKKVSYIGQRL